MSIDETVANLPPKPKGVRTRDWLGQLFGVSPRMIDAAHRVRQSGRKDLEAKIVAGELSIHKALKIIDGTAGRYDAWDAANGHLMRALRCYAKLAPAAASPEDAERLLLLLAEASVVAERCGKFAAANKGGDGRCF